MTCSDTRRTASDLRELITAHRAESQHVTKSRGLFADHRYRLSMESVFDGVRRKLDRAADHLRAIDAGLNAFVRGDTHPRAGIAIGVDDTRTAWEAIVNLPADYVVDPSWGLLIGEVLYQLRSSLDHIVNALVASPSRYTAFPIYDKEDDYNKKDARVLEGLAPEYRSVIDELQPFRTQPDAPTLTTLWAINELARIDRHRTLHSTDLCILNCQMSWDPPDAVFCDYTATFPMPLSDRALLAKGRINSDVVEHAKPEVLVTATVDLVLLELGEMRRLPPSWGALAVRGLGRMIQHVRSDIVPRLESAHA
jgi:hypothetical protein